MVIEAREVKWRHDAARCAFEVLNEDFEEIFAERTHGETGLMKRFLAQRRIWLFMVTAEIQAIAEEEAQRILERGEEE